MTIKINRTAKICLTVLKMVGIWSPEALTGFYRMLYKFYSVFFYMSTIALAILLLTNMSYTFKIVNIMSRRERICKVITANDQVLAAETSGKGREIVKRCDKANMFFLVVYISFTCCTITGWATSVEKGQLPIRAWYPYNTTKSPAYELTYLHQVGGIFVSALNNICTDILVSVTIAQCRCRLQLLGLKLRTLCSDLDFDITDKYTISKEQEATAIRRLEECVREHQATLEAAKELQRCFSEATFLQFFVSRVIICVTAYQLVSQTRTLDRLFLGTHLIDMMYELYIYCYQGENLTEESADVADHAYECPWYACSVKLRKMILIVMTRTRREVIITAGGFTVISLGSFMTVIKASYSLFTLLKQVAE